MVKYGFKKRNKLTQAIITFTCFIWLSKEQVDETTRLKNSISKASSTNFYSFDSLEDKNTTSFAAGNKLHVFDYTDETLVNKFTTVTLPSTSTRLINIALSNLAVIAFTDGAIKSYNLPNDGSLFYEYDKPTTITSPNIKQLISSPDLGNIFFALYHNSHCAKFDSKIKKSVSKLSTADYYFTHAQFIPIENFMVIGTRSGKLLVYSAHKDTYAPEKVVDYTGYAFQFVYAMEVIQLMVEKEYMGLVVASKKYNYLPALPTHADSVARQTWDEGSGLSHPFTTASIEGNKLRLLDISDNFKFSREFTYDKGGEIIAISWFKTSEMFVVCNNEKTVTLFKIGFVEKVSDYTFTSGNLRGVKAVSFTQLIVAGSDTQAHLLISDGLGCHKFCQTCEGPGIFQCKTCFTEYEFIAPLKYCEIKCLTTQYRNTDENKCYPCHESCKSCSGAGELNCILCQTDYFAHPDGSCKKACIPGTYKDTSVDPPVCSYCHIDCKTCTGPLNNQCLSCYIENEFILQITNMCKRKCDDGTYKFNKERCEKCHAGCLHCYGGTDSDCTKCHDHRIQFLNENDFCRDCLNDYDQDQQICNMTIDVAFVRAPYEVVDYNSSVTLRVNSTRYDHFLSIFEKVEWVNDHFDLQIEGYKSEELSWRVKMIRNSLTFYVNVTRSTYGKNAKVLLKPKNAKRLVSLEELRNIGELMFRNFTTEMEIWNLVKAPKEENLEMVRFWSDIANKVIYIECSILLVATLLFFLKNIDLSYDLINYFRIAKLLHRFKFINISYPLTVETFLVGLNNLYQSGQDYRRDDIDILQKDYRGKLSFYGIPVVSTVNFIDKYIAYFGLLTIYFSFVQVGKYVTIGKDKKAVYERKIMRAVGRIKVMLTLLLSNDLFYASVRNILHFKTSAAKNQIQSIQGYSISFISFMCLCVELTMIISDNIFNNDLERIARNNKPDRIKLFQNEAKLRAEYKAYQKVKLKANEYVNPEYILDLRDRYKDLKIPEGEGPDTSGLLDYEKKYKFSLGIEFSMKGIKLEKLDTWIGKYYNACNLMKYLLFETIFISTQSFPLAQVSLLILIQFSSIIMTILGIFHKKVFKSLAISFFHLLLEFAVIVYFVYNFIQAICETGEAIYCYQVDLRERVLFIMIGLMIISLCIAFLYFSLSCYFELTRVKKISKTEYEFDIPIEKKEFVLEEVEPEKKKNVFRKALLEDEEKKEIYKEHINKGGLLNINYAKGGEEAPPVENEEKLPLASENDEPEEPPKRISDKKDKGGVENSNKRKKKKKRRRKKKKPEKIEEVKEELEESVSHLLNDTSQLEELGDALKNLKQSKDTIHKVEEDENESGSDEEKEMDIGKKEVLEE